MPYDPELYNVGNPGSTGYEDLLKRQNAEVGADLAGGGTVPGATFDTTPPAISAMDATPVGGDLLATPPAQKTDWLKSFGETMAKPGVASTLMDVGAALTANPNNPYLSNVIKIGGGIMKSQALNEANRKMIQQGLAGDGQNPMQGPGGNATPALSGLDVLGLTPEQITNLYSTATSLREKERQHPLDVMKTQANAYQALQSGDLAGAEAAAKNYKLQIDQLPANQKAAALDTYYKLKKQITDIQLTEEQVGETKARAANLPLTGKKIEQETTNLSFIPNKTVAETMEAWGNVSLKRDEANFNKWKTDPMRHREAIALARAQPFGVHSNPTGYTVFSKVTGNKEDVVINATTPASTVNSLGLMMTTSTMMPFVEKDFIAKLPPGTKNAREQWANFIATMGKEATPEAKDVLIRGQLSPANMQIYNQTLDLYRSGIQNNVPTAALDNMARATILNAPTVAPPSPGASGVPPPAKGMPYKLSPQQNSDLTAALKSRNAPPRKYPITHKKTGEQMIIEWNGKEIVRVIR